MTTLDIEVIGEGLSGLDAGSRGNLHLGMQRGSEVISPVPATAGTVAFALSVEVTPVGEGRAFDARGPYVHGKRGDRFLYLSWGEVDRDGAFGMLMRTKIKLDSIRADLIARAMESGSTLRGTFSLVDAAGKPRSGTIRTDLIAWTVAAGADRG